MTDPAFVPPAADPPTPEEVAAAYGLPVGWKVFVNVVEEVPAPLDPGMHPHSNFARITTLVHNTIGQLISADADPGNAAGQALAYCQSTQIPYDRLTWGDSHP